MWFNLSTFGGRLFLKILAGLAIYLVSASFSFLFFSTVASPASFLEPTKLTDVTSPRAAGGDIPCPINGALYEAATWQNRRPLAVVIENHIDARPQSGLSRADVVYESVAEGGITRFLAIYFCQDAGDLTPVRSVRTFHLNWVSEYDAAFAHVGGANTPGKANALGQIREYNIKDLDQFGLGFPTFWRGGDKFAPHNVHTTTAKLQEAAFQRGWTAVDEATGKAWDENFKAWSFKDQVPFEVRPASASAKVNFWSDYDDYAVTWQYDQQKNSYLRFHKDQAQIDQLTGEQMEAKVVIVLFAQESTANDGYAGNIHLVYKMAGTGDAIIFQDGKVTEGSWSKKDRTSRTQFFDQDRQEFKFNRGLIFVQMVPVGVEITY